MSKQDPTAPRPNSAPVNLTLAQSRRLKQLLANGPVTPAALKAAGLSEDALRKAGFKGVINSQNLVLWTAGKVTDHDSALEKVNETIKKLEERLGDGTIDTALKAGSAGGIKSFVQYLRDAKATDSDIREALGIFTDVNLDELTDGETFAEYVTNAQAITRAMREQVNGHATEIKSLRGSVTAVTGRVTMLESANRLPVWVWLFAAVVGVVAGLIWNAADFSHQVTAKAGDVTINMTVSSVADAAWVALIFGLAIGLAVLGIFSLVTGNRRKISTTEKSATDSSTTTVFRKSTKVPPIDEHPTQVIQPVLTGTGQNA